MLNGTNSGCNAVFNSTVIISAFIYLTFTSPISSLAAGSITVFLVICSSAVAHFKICSVAEQRVPCKGEMSSTSSITVSLGRGKYLWSLRNKDDGEGMIEKNPGSRVNICKPARSNRSGVRDVVY